MERSPRPSAAELREKHLADAHEYIITGTPLDQAACVDCLKNPEALFAELENVTIALEAIANGTSEGVALAPGAQDRLQALSKLAEEGIRRGYGSEVRTKSSHFIEYEMRRNGKTYKDSKTASKVRRSGSGGLFL